MLSCTSKHQLFALIGKRHFSKSPLVTGLTTRWRMLATRRFPDSNLRILDKLFRIAHKFPNQVCYSFIREDGTPRN
jgi:hypothetical protein